VCHVTSGNLCIAVLILALLATLDKTDFIVPPHDILPVRFVVFVELWVVCQVLSYPHDNVVRGNAWVLWVSGHVPLAPSEVEGTYAESHIVNCSVFSLLVLKVDGSMLSIFIARQKQDTTLHHFLQQVAGSEATLVVQVRQGWHFTVHQLHFKRSHFELKGQPLRFQVNQCFVFLNAAEFPELVWEVSCTVLQEGNWRESSRLELNLIDGWVVVESLFVASDQISGPLLGLVVPNGDFNGAGLFSHIDSWLESDLHVHLSSVRGWFTIWDLLKTLLH